MFNGVDVTIKKMEKNSLERIHKSTLLNKTKCMESRSSPFAKINGYYHLVRDKYKKYVAGSTTK